MKSKIIITTIFILSVVGVSVGTYIATSYFVSKQVYQKAYKQGSKVGVKQGYENGWNEAFKVLDTSGTCKTSARADDPLGCLYDPNSNAAKNSQTTQPTNVYVNSSPQHCTSYSYGIDNQFTSTYCY